MIATTSSTDKSHAVQGLPVISCLLTFPSDFYHEKAETSSWLFRDLRIFRDQWCCHVSEIVDKAEQRKLREVSTNCELTYIFLLFYP